MMTQAKTARRNNARRGVALILVLFAVTMAVVLAITFSVSQATSTGISENGQRHTRARVIAESGLEIAINHIQTSDTWRTDLVDGVWVTDQAFEDGSFTLTGQDGEDLDGDGSIDGSEGDGDLADDDSDKVTLTAVGTFRGVTHRVQAIVTAGQRAIGPVKVLMVVAQADDLTSDEQSRVDLIEGWGWTVNTIRGRASAADYEAAMENSHVVYVPDDGGTSLVGARLADATLSVVFEDGDMNDELGLATSQAFYSGTDVRIVDISHYITSPFTIGSLTIATNGRRAECPSGSVGPSVRPLAWWPGTESRVVAVVDAGQTLVGGDSAPGRRAVSPFAGFHMDDLTDDGRLLLKRMLEWAAQSAMYNSEVEPITNWIKGSSISAPDGEDRLLVVTVSVETNSSIASASYGNQPMTLAVSGYESTGVGARNYIYYLRDVGISAASDSTIRVTYSGSIREQSYSSRMYQHVSQANPIRVTDTTTSAGPPTISSVPLEVSNGDMVVSSAHVGHSRAYTWADPLELGTNNTGWTSSHSAADYAVTDDPGTVVASATCSAPNRQVLVTAVIQPRARASGEGIVPQLLVLYEFDEEQPAAELKGHWPLDDAGDGGAVAIYDDVRVQNEGIIDGYHGDTGAYGAGNKEQSVILVTNTSNSGSIRVQNSAKIFGSTYNRPGANPTNVVSINGSAVITGNRYEQSVAFSLPSVSPPSGMPSSQGNKTYNGGNHTISSDRKFNDLTIRNGARITIQGDVRIQATGDLRMQGGEFVVADGNRLRIYVGDDIALQSNSIINADTTGAERVEIHQYGSNCDVQMQHSAKISGIVHVGRDLAMYQQSAIYGAIYVADDIDIRNDAAVHVDLDMPGFHIVPVADAVGTNPGLAHGGIMFAQAGARGFTNTAVRFDGNDDFVRFPHHDDYLLHHGTLSFWFRSESLSGERALVSKDSAGYDTGGHLHIYTDGATLKARIQADGSSPYGTGNSFEVEGSGLTTNTWYHVTVTIGAGGLQLYLNGDLVDTEAYPGGLATSSGGIGNYEPMVIGAGTESSGDLDHLPLTDRFRGRIDEFRIYQEVLDAGQIGRLYRGQDIGERTAGSYIVRDTSGLGTPLDMFIDNTAAVGWEDGGGLAINQGTVLRAPERPSKIRNGATATGEFTVEIIAEPSTVDAVGRRLLWYGPNSGADTNLDLRLQASRHVARVRNADTSNNPPNVEGQTGIAADTEYHLLFVFDGERVEILRNGVSVGSADQPGDLLSWDSSYGLSVANLPLGSAPWLGTLRRTAIYDRAMNRQQTDNLVNGLPPGAGGTMGSGGFAYRWIEHR